MLHFNKIDQIKTLFVSAIKWVRNKKLMHVFSNYKGVECFI